MVLKGYPLVFMLSATRNHSQLFLYFSLVLAAVVIHTVVFEKQDAGTTTRRSPKADQRRRRGLTPREDAELRLAEQLAEIAAEALSSNDIQLLETEEPIVLPRRLPAPLLDPEDDGFGDVLLDESGYQLGAEDEGLETEEGTVILAREEGDEIQALWGVWVLSSDDTMDMGDDDLEDGASELYFLASWKDYPLECNSWESAESVRRWVRGPVRGGQTAGDRMIEELLDALQRQLDEASAVMGLVAEDSDLSSSEAEEEPDEEEDDVGEEEEAPKPARRTRRAAAKKVQRPTSASTRRRSARRAAASSSSSEESEKEEEEVRPKRGRPAKGTQSTRGRRRSTKRGAAASGSGEEEEEARKPVRYSLRRSTRLRKK